MIFQDLALKQGKQVVGHNVANAIAVRRALTPIDVDKVVVEAKETKSTIELYRKVLRDKKELVESIKSRFS